MSDTTKGFLIGFAVVLLEVLVFGGIGFILGALTK
jgi:hypothetical protein